MSHMAQCTWTLCVHGQLHGLCGPRAEPVLHPQVLPNCCTQHASISLLLPVPRENTTVFITGKETLSYPPTLL